MTLAYRSPLPVAGLALCTAVVLALALRATGLMSLFPILVDESIYLRWAEIIDHQGQWFVSLLDAKQPLSYWLYALARKGFPDADPLLGARSVSVAAGGVATALLFQLGRQLGGTLAALAAAFFYALVPYGVFYDRLAYIDALVNCFAIALTLAAIRCFRDAQPTRGRAVAVGAILGLGLFTKTTMIAFTLIPVTAALVWQRGQPALAIRRLALIYTIAVLPPVLSYLMVPDAPVFAINHLLLHHNSFFTSPTALLSDPLINVARNGVLVGEYLHHYLTPLFAAAALTCAIFLASRREPAAAFVAAAFVVPVTLQIVVLEYFPSRFLFPHVWPLIIAASVTLERVSSQYERPTVAAIACASLAASLGFGSVQLLREPDKRLHRIDAGEFLSSGPFSGYGIREAIEYLRNEAVHSPLIVLTDPIWGTPADAIYPYLNRRSGIRVYDAWWAQLSASEPLLPAGRREVMRSQYERVSDGFVDFDAPSRVLYITDTNYHTLSDVRRRQPAARLLAQFPKRNGRDSIDVYQLR